MEAEGSRDRAEPLGDRVAQVADHWIPTRGLSDYDGDPEGEFEARRTRTNWDGEHVSDMIIYHDTDESEAERWFVACGDEVFGVYPSLAALDAAQVLDPGLEIESTSVDDSDNDPSEETT